MSLRQVAKRLGGSPAYLSYMINGKRPWRKDLYQHYMGVVNAFVNSDGALLTLRPPTTEVGMVAPTGFEPVT